MSAGAATTSGQSSPAAEIPESVQSVSPSPADHPPQIFDVPEFVSNQPTQYFQHVNIPRYGYAGPARPVSFEQQPRPYHRRGPLYADRQGAPLVVDAQYPPHYEVPAPDRRFRMHHNPAPLNCPPGVYSLPASANRWSYVPPPAPEELEDTLTLELAAGVRFKPPTQNVDVQLALRCVRANAMPPNHQETLSYFFNLGVLAFKNTISVAPKKSANFSREMPNEFQFEGFAPRMRPNRDGRGRRRQNHRQFY